jgi:hypothetical protein
MVGAVSKTDTMHLNPVTAKIVKIGEGRVEEGIVRPRAKRERHSRIRSTSLSVISSFVRS